MLSRLSPYWLWALMALPGLGILMSILNATDAEAIHEALHPTGEFGARFMIIAMLATPLMMALPSWRGPRWLVRNRRYFGVAAFAYALAHTVFYLIDIGLAGALDEATKLEIWTGWVAFLIFVPLAITSNDRFVRAMGPDTLIIKKGEHGALLFCGDDIFSAPAYPLEEVIDPTGAGDTFLGGFAGHLLRVGSMDPESMRQAVVVGSALASFVVEAFGPERLKSITTDELEGRIGAFRRLCEIPDGILAA